MRPLGEEFTPDCNVAIMVGVKSRELWNKHARAGISLVYFDKGYTRDTTDDDLRAWKYWRVSVNGHHPTSKFSADYPDDRLKAIGWKFRPWRKSGTSVLIAGSSAKYHAFYDLKDPTSWASKLVKEIEGITRREIIYRPKPSWHEAVPITGSTFSRDKKQTIDTDLIGAHCLVTHGSNACFEAMLAGVPSIILGSAVMRPISSTSLDEIENPRLASDAEREALLRFLAYQQWTLKELVDGKAWPIIRRQLFE